MLQVTGTRADRLPEPWFTSLSEQLPGLRLFDCHTHLGCADPDGSCFAADELRAALEVVDARAVVFPLAEPGSSHEANNRMLAAADGRLIPFCRVDPRDGGSAEAHRVPIIVHAGRGIPSLGRDALELARAFPDAPIILAHAAISDLSWIWHEASRQRNLFFDTAWWNTADQLALFALLAPGQILFASDTPYGRTVSAATVVLRAALAAGLSDAQVIAVAGGQLERLLAGADPRDLGAAPSKPAPSPGPLLEWVHTLLVAASVLELLDRHAEYLASDPPRHGPRVPAIHLIFAAAAVARTPGLPLP